MRTGLTKQEKTTDIWFDEKDPLIHIRTHNTDLKKRLAAPPPPPPPPPPRPPRPPPTGAGESEKARFSFPPAPPLQRATPAPGAGPTPKRQCS